jgi:uridylate kinase
MYKRVLLKISGEQLSGEHDSGIDPNVAKYLAHECASVIETGCQLILVVGGGNMVRGERVAGNGIKRVTADQMGMLSSLINSLAVTDIFESEGVVTRCMSSIYAEQVAESYSYRLADKHLERGRLVVVAGGIARPFFTTDTATVSIALEMGCDVVLKATKVDGVYDKDPAKFKDAKLLPQITFQESVANEAIKVMDKAALGLAMEQHMSIIVFNPMQPGNILKAVKGEQVGSHIAEKL